MTQATRLIGIDIGGTKCAVSYLDEQGIIFETSRFKTAGVDETLDAITSAVIPLFKGFQPVIGISAGTLGAARGMITKAPNLPGWDNVPVVDTFQKRFAA
jgi:glucokinase